MILRGISRTMTPCSTGRGQITPAMPTTAKALKKFEPIILPMTRACSFFLVAAMAEASSGKLVPTATMVSPMMMSLIPMNVAMPTAPQISRRELAISKIKPARSQNTAFFIGIISGSSCFWCKIS